ncbi:MAG TPA: D-glycerate dehydrogenase [Terriglobales bacterium]|jgi:glyoxylate reductase
MPSTFRVFATCDIGESLEILHRKGYEVEIYPEPHAPPKSLIVEKVRSGIDGLISSLRDKIDGEVFEAGKGTLKVVAQYAVGTDNINRAEANRYKIPYTNTPDVLTEATAEYAFFVMGALARKLWSAEKMLRDNQWNSWHPSLPFLGHELTGKIIAIIGTGRIGRAMIKKCVGFDMNILCYNTGRENPEFASAMQEIMDLRHKHGLTREKQWIQYVNLEDALREADFVSLHVPLLREGESASPTYHMFNEKTLRLMKPSAMIINTARGPVIDEVTLAHALKENWIAGAALDVYATEPLPSDSPLRDPAIEDRCRLYPHHGSATYETRLSTDPDRGMAGRSIQGLMDVLEKNYGGDLTKMPFVVNKEAFTK